MGHYVVFPNTVPCKEEINMVVASSMTCKIDLIWRHMKTLYIYNCLRKLQGTMLFLKLYQYQYFFFYPLHTEIQDVIHKR